MNLNNAFYGFFAALTKIDQQYLQVWLLPRAPYSAARQRHCARSITTAPRPFSSPLPVAAEPQAAADVTCAAAVQQNGLQPLGGIYKALDGQNSNLRWDVPTSQLRVRAVHNHNGQVQVAAVLDD